MQASHAVTHRGRSQFRRGIQTLLYESFRHAQGDQTLQVHFIESYVRLLKEKNVKIDWVARDELRPRIRRHRLPRGHVAIPSEQQVRAQFEFWWLTMWDLLTSVFAEDAALVPSAEQLADRMITVGGTEEMSSFTPLEMWQLDQGLASYRDTRDPTRGADHVIRERFLPNLIRVEWNFQGNGSRYPARPRTDGGDIYESKMLDHCGRAVEALPGQSSDLVVQIYLEVSRRLDWLALHRPQDPTYLTYENLVAAYRRNHGHGAS